jgi:mono/diheme cytochrome c family protein
MQTGGNCRIICRRMTIVAMSVLFALQCATGESFAQSIREQVEAEWQIQDQARMAEILNPGVVCFVQTELTWPGVAEQPVPLAAGGNWKIVWADGRQFGFGANRTTVDLQVQGTLDVPVRLTVESVVFTPRRPERRIVFEGELTEAGPVAVEFQIAHEGAAAVIVKAEQGKSEVREGRAFYVEPVAETLDRARRLLVDFEISAPEELASLCERARALAGREQADGSDRSARAALLGPARWAARRIAFMNPRIDFDEIVLVKRFTQETYPDVCLNHMPWVSRPGGDICVLTLEGADAECKVRNVINGALGPGHVHGMDLWWDADRVVFGYSKAKSNQPPAGWLDRRTSYELRRTEEPTHIFEIGLDSEGLRQLTFGEWSDLDPTYLASGDVSFVSERAECSLQCNEMDKDETSCNLYVMRPDGSNIRHMSVTKDGDYLPHALDDGTVAYTRWEYQERSWAHIQSIWTIRPDGTFADALYKQHMNDPWALEDMRSIPGSKKLLAVATGHHTLAAGPVVIIDPHQGMNNPAGIKIVTPGVVPPEGGMTGTPVEAGGVVGRGGYYMTPWPLSDKHFLVSYAYCNGATGGPASEVDPAGYAVYLIDVHGTKELIYRDPEISCFVPIPLRPRPRPPIVADRTDQSVPYATCMVANAAYGVEGIDPKSVRYIRISQRLQWPYTNEYGGERYEPDVKPVMINWTPARVIGEVPVESDGSAHFVVLVDTPVYFQLLDENHMELRRMRSFISFQPGEARGCVGCHETREEAPAVINDSFPLAVIREPSIPQPPPWGDVPISYLRDVQPVFNRHCTSCHGGLKPAAGLDFSGGLTANYNRSYDTILANDLVSRSNVAEDARITQPLEFGSHKSKLVRVLREGACSSRAKLTDEDWLRLVTWIDANGPYHDGFINKRQEHPPYDMPADGELVRTMAAVHARRCGDCHSPEEVSRVDWIDINMPGESLFLTAPLAKNAQGTGRCAKSVYKDRDDPDYRALLEVVETAVGRAWKYPRRDLKGLGGRRSKLAQSGKGR